MGRTRFKLQFEEAGGYVLCRAAGATTVEGMRDLAERILEACERAGVGACVIDCARMTGGLDLVDLFEVGVYFAQTLESRVWLAAINMPEHWRDNGFSEEVIANRRGVLRHFASLGAAEGWLRAVAGPPG